jgi:hypothetical protein
MDDVHVGSRGYVFTESLPINGYTYHDIITLTLLVPY